MSLQKKTKKELIEEVQELRKRNEALEEGVLPGDHGKHQPRVSELWYLFENTADLIQVFDKDGNILFVNKAWQSTLGYSEEELHTISFKDIIHPDNRENTLRNLEKISQGEHVENFDTVLVSKDNKSVYLTGSVNYRVEDDKKGVYRAILHDYTEKVKDESAQYLYYSIGNLTISSKNLEDLLENIHNKLREVIAVNNFHVALHDTERHQLNFPYYVDENFGGRVDAYSRKVGNGLTEYSLFRKEPTFLYEEDIRELAAKEEIELYGLVPKIWLGVPLKLEDRVIGVIAVKSHSDRDKYKKRHLDLLNFISGQIAIAIERKQYEDKINEQTARLKAIFESSYHLMWSVDRKRNLTSFNQNYSDALYKIHGVRPKLDEGADPKKRLMLSSSEYHEYVDVKYKEAFRGRPQHFETRVQDRQGNEIWKEIFLNPIFLPDGSIEEVSGIAHDITEKKNWEMALQESEEKFRNIFESFQDIYYRTDTHGQITMVSPSVYELTGYKPEEIIGRNITEFFEKPKGQEKLIKELLRTGTVRNFETNLIKKDGSVIQSISNIRFIYNQNRKPIALDGVARDITYLKKASEELLKAKEIAERSLKVKESFLANMSHEIRTPMNGIIGMIDLLCETQLNEEQEKYVYTIKKSSQTLLTILNDILDLSKLEAGKMQLRLTSISLPSAVEKLYTLFYQKAASKGIGFNYFIDPQLPGYIMADETRLLQVMSNLTSNAIKFTDQGYVDIRVMYYDKNGDDYTIKVEIEDTGIGISEENQEKLFNTFSQADNSTTKTYSGTGLGLAISKELCKMMNGDIGVESELYKGSTFYFTFEAKESKRNPKNKDVDEPAIKQSELQEKQPHLLLVDDNSVNRMVSQEILKKAGCKVDVAENGKESIEKAGETNYDMIFMDIQMPDMDGVEAARKVREMNHVPRPPIIAMTAYSMKDDQKRFLDAGLDDYIAKPIESEDLVKKVRQWVGQKITEEKVSENGKSGSSSENGNGEVINDDVVEQLKQYGGTEVVTTMMDEFEREGMEYIEACNKSLKSEDYNIILNNLHTLKGSAGTLGITKVASLAEQIEKKLKQDDFENINKDIETLNEAFEEFQESYKKHFKE